MKRFVRRERCPTCGVEVGITRGELERRIAQCGCGARLALEVRDGGDGGPHRAMQKLEARPLMAGPPTGRIVESLGPVPSLVINQERGRRRFESMATVALGAAVVVLAASFNTTGGMIAALLYLLAATWDLLRRERLRVVDGVLEHRGTVGAARVALADIDRVEVISYHVLVRRRDGETLRLLDEQLGLDDAAREWIAAWIRDAVRGSRAPRDP